MATARKRVPTKNVTKKAPAKTEPVKKTIKKDICFVIMPFGGWFDKYYEDIYSQAIKAANLMPKRADDLYRPSNIVQDIWSYTKRAKIILADLTGKNPNVFYELGLAHALAKPAILITENMDDIPFDLRSLRIIQYDKNSHDWGAILKKRIELAIKETIESPNETIPSAFLETSQIKPTTVTKNEKEFIEIKQEIESLKKIVNSSSIVNKGRPIPMQEAITKIKDYSKRGMTEQEIFDILTTTYNVPKNWLRYSISKYMPANL